MKIEKEILWIPEVYHGPVLQAKFRSNEFSKMKLRIADAGPVFLRQDKRQSCHNYLNNHIMDELNFKRENLKVIKFISFLY